MRNKLRVLLIDCTRPLDHDEFVHSGAWNRHHPPVALLAISSFVKRSNFAPNVEFRVLDSTIDYQNLVDLYRLIDDFCPDILGLRCMHWYTEQFHEILQYVKNLNSAITTIAGGPYANSSPQDLLSMEKNLDAVIKGEGEESFLDFLQAQYYHRPLENIPGLYYRKSDGTIIFGGERLQNPNIDELGFPNWEELDFSRYEKILAQAPILRKSAPILTSRGCPYRCTYCHDLFQKKLRVRSPENIVRELEILNSLGVRDIMVIDDIFNLDNKRVLKIFDLIAKKNLQMRFYFPNGLRGDQMPNEVIDAMVEGGCIQFIYALESGSERIQKFMKKFLRLDKFAQAVEHTISKKVMVDMFLMVGFPGETKEDALKTIDFLMQFRSICFPVLNILNIFPGTEMHRWLQENEDLQSVYTAANPGYHNLDAVSPNSELRMLITEIRMKLVSQYILSRERLLAALEIQKLHLSEEEILAAYRSYFQNPKLNSLEKILSLSR